MGTVYLNAACAAKTLGAVKDPSFIDLIGKNAGAYYLGSIAEELLCFFDCFSKEENTFVRGIASELKSEGVPLFNKMKNYIGKAPAPERDVLKAYLAGMAADYACDYRTSGYLATIMPSGGTRSEMNEAAVKLDCCVMKEAKELPDLKAALEGIGPEGALAIEKMYSDVINEKRRIIIPDGIIADCLQKLIKALGQKKSLLPIPRPGKEFCYSPCEDTGDLMNSKHRKWTDTNGDISNFSLPEMMGYAARDASKLAVKLLGAADRAIPEENCEFLFRNLR
ncbi:MAG: hypothetical protein J5822_09080 [Eubacteriaceae bacterium]|nr:hypothetical protein [Eubacteriaceae bacterium]